MRDHPHDARWTGIQMTRCAMAVDAGAWFRWARQRGVELLPSVTDEGQPVIQVFESADGLCAGVAHRQGLAIHRPGAPVSIGTLRRIAGTPHKS